MFPVRESFNAIQHARTGDYLSVVTPPLKKMQGRPAGLENEREIGSVKDHFLMRLALTNRRVPV